MKFSLPLLLTILLLAASCTSDKSQSANISSAQKAADSTGIERTVADNNFGIIDDFKTSASTFQHDTFDLHDQSTDGGKLIRSNSNDKNYLVFDVWLFGETGKLHAIYWTDKQTNIRIVQWTDYKYDKPYYEPGFNSTSTTDFHSFVDNSYVRYDSSRNQVYDSSNLESANRVKRLFANVSNEIADNHAHRK
ncbi:MAG: hypothetical protein QM762_18560 [Chryseolinea sp.]